MRPSSQNLIAVATTAKTVARSGHATPRGTRVVPSAASQRTLCTVCALNAPSHGRASASNHQVRLVKRPASRVILPAVFTAGQRRRASVVSDAAVENGTYVRRVAPGSPGLDLPSSAVNTDDIGPIQEYDRRVDAGLIRNDNHQRGK